MWAASPARNRLPKRMGSATKLRRGRCSFRARGRWSGARGLRGPGGCAVRPRRRRRSSSPPCRSAALAGSSGCGCCCACCTAQSPGRCGRRSARAPPASHRPAGPASQTGRRAFVGADGGLGHAGAAHAVKTVAARDEVAGEGVRLAVFLIRDAGVAPSKSCTCTLAASYTVVRPAAARASIRSCVTSVWP